MERGYILYYKNIMIQIFRDHWDRFKEIYPWLITDDIEENVRKMIGCGLIENGYFEYWCLRAGCWEKKKVGFTCKSRFCLRCRVVYIERWLVKMEETIFQQISHRHVILTVPGSLWKYFHSKEMLRVLADCGVKLINDIVGKHKGKELKVGIILVIQTAGRAGRWNPHLHILVTEGGLDKDGRWHDVRYIDREVLKKKWMYYLLRGVREALKGDKEVESIIDKIYEERKGKGLIARAKKEKVRKRDIVGYLIKYVAGPPITLSRIIKYDGEYVTYYYREHPTEKEVRVKVSVYQFISWMIEQIPPKQFKMVRHYGLYARRMFREVKGLIDRIFRRIKIASQGLMPFLSKIKDSLHYRGRMIRSFGKDPLICCKCGGEMELWYIWHPRYGYIYDLGRDSPEVVEECKYRYEEEEKERGTEQLTLWNEEYEACLSWL
jgi:hypothetical protein